jgi:hypothetical protein
VAFWRLLARPGFLSHDRISQPSQNHLSEHQAAASRTKTFCPVTAPLDSMSHFSPPGNLRPNTHSVRLAFPFLSAKRRDDGLIRMSIRRKSRITL